MLFSLAYQFQTPVKPLYPGGRGWRGQKNTARAKRLGVNVKILSFLIFIPLQILMIPFAITGVLWTAYKQVLVSKKLGTSQTAIEVLNGRWTMHVFGMRQDIAAAKLANRLPNTSTLGLWLVLFPLWLKYKISGSYFAYPILPVSGKESIAELNKVSTYMNDKSQVEVQIDGYADWIGTVEYNMALSERRAKAAYNYLTDKKNVNENRLSYQYFGEAVPIAPNKKEDGSDNPEGRQLNRRCEFKIDESGTAENVVLKF